MNPRSELIALQERSETLCIRTEEMLIFYIWTQADCLDFVRDWGRIIVPGIGHEDFWPMGSTISGDVLFVEKEDNLFAMFHDELEIVFLLMSLGEFLRRLMEKQEDLEECLFEGTIDFSDQRYQFAKSDAYADAVAKLRKEMDQSAEQSSSRLPKMCPEEMAKLMKQYRIVNWSGDSDP